MPLNPSKAFRFLDIPPEIREKIYILLVHTPQAVNLSPTHLSTTLPPSHWGRSRTDEDKEIDTDPLYGTFPLSLLLSCVQIHNELLPVYFMHNTFALTIRRHNDTYSTFLSPSSPFRPNLLSIRSLRLIILRFGSKNYFAGTLVPILQECILNGRLRRLEVWVRDTTGYLGRNEGKPRSWETGGGMGGKADGGMTAEYQNWGVLRELCQDPWLENVTLKAGWVEESNGEVVQRFELCKSVPLY